MKKFRYDRLWVIVYDVAAGHPWAGIAAGLVLVALLIPLLTLAGGYSGTLGPSIPLVFLVPMLIASTLGGRIAGVVVSVVAVAAWDWFFIPPLYSPTIGYPRDLLALVIFLFDALLTGQLANVVRQRAEVAVQRARTSEALYELSVALIGSHDLAGVLPALTERLRETFDLQACAILLRDPDGYTWHTAARSGAVPDDLSIERSRNIAGVLSWVGSTGRMCGLNQGDAVTRPEEGAGPVESGGPRAQFWPLRVGSRLVGVVEMVFKAGTDLDVERDRLLTTLLNGAAIALEQERLFKEEQEASLARESDRLKSALLSSVSHDLRTPLAGIKAAASSLLQEDVQWSEADRRAFAADIDTEADRLTRLVSNLLDLSRIEAGALRPTQDWEDVGELINRVVGRMRPRLANHPLTVSVEPDMPAARFDAVHMEQVLSNLIENAAKYSPEGAPITIAGQLLSGSDGGREISLSVTDAGTGISRDQRGRIFDKFYRIAGMGHRTGGTGMGLAIVKGLVEAGGGHVVVDSEVGRGSTFTVLLPLSQDPRAQQNASDVHQPALELPPP